MLSLELLGLLVCILLAVGDGGFAAIYHCDSVC